MAKKQYGMVIDLHNCVGCAACDIACKSENNVPDGFAWSNHMVRTTGTFPAAQYQYIPTLCNHCTDAPCVTNCPTKAMYKSEDGITLLDANKCIGCRACQLACPYGVIYFNEETPHAEFRDDKAAIPECTASGDETREASGQPIPYYNEERAETLPGIRPKGVMEKCTFCDHLLARGEEPACVTACRPGPACSATSTIRRARPARPSPSTGPRCCNRKREPAPTSSTSVISEAQRSEGAARANLYFAMARAFALPADMGASDIAATRTAAEGFDGPVHTACVAVADAWEDALTDREALSLAYARLFLGPFEILAPPYASMYLDPDGQLMGEISQWVADAYREAGVEVGGASREAPDHITLELEFMYFLGHRWVETGAAEWRRRQAHFEEAHLRHWLGEFAQAVADADVHPFYSRLAHLVESNADGY